jgi:hypothetical protein
MSDDQRMASVDLQGNQVMRLIETIQMHCCRQVEVKDK